MPRRRRKGKLSAKPWPFDKRPPHEQAKTREHVLDLWWSCDKGRKEILDLYDIT